MKKFFQPDSSRLYMKKDVAGLIMAIHNPRSTVRTAANAFLQERVREMNDKQFPGMIWSPRESNLWAMLADCSKTDDDRQWAIGRLTCLYQSGRLNTDAMHTLRALKSKPGLILEEHYDGAAPGQDW